MRASARLCLCMRRETDRHDSNHANFRVPTPIRRRTPTILRHCAGGVEEALTKSQSKSSRSKYFTSERSERSTHLCIDQRHFKPRRTRRGRVAFSSESLKSLENWRLFSIFPSGIRFFSLSFFFSFIYLAEKRLVR